MATKLNLYDFQNSLQLPRGNCNIMLIYSLFLFSSKFIFRINLLIKFIELQKY